MMHCRRWVSTGLDRLIEDTKYGLHVRHFCDSEAKLATLKFLRGQKNLPPTAVNQKHPGFGRFSRSTIELRFAFFFSKSLCGAKNKGPGGPTK
jgi:hypothetical protein